MNELLLAMATDMGIKQFTGETEASFTYRLLFSALGQWCLRVAQNTFDGTSGTTKHNQTIVLNELLEKYTKVFPSIGDRFVDFSNQQINISVFIRRVYEETGYLITNESNHNRLANFGRSILLGDKALFFGLPASDYTVNGLGVFAPPTAYSVSTKEFLIRDNLTHEEYFQVRFDPIDFYDRDVEQAELEFFNPLSKNVPFRSWEKQPTTDCTVARKSETGPFYRIMRIGDSLQFSDEPIEQQSDSLTSYEYRRLYFALKARYGNPLKAVVAKVDADYSTVKIGGRLPNREYYYLLLLAWPINNAFDKINFLIHNDLLGEPIDMLKNIGVETIIGGHET
jgi:hypothetical protein